MSDPERTLPAEEAAEHRTNISGWACKTCGRFYGDEGGAERAARFCCQKDHACETDGCKNRAERSYIICDPCRDLARVKRWEALKEVEWNGETPLGLEGEDKDFFREREIER